MNRFLLLVSLVILSCGHSQSPKQTTDVNKDSTLPEKSETKPAVQEVKNIMNKSDSIDKENSATIVADQTYIQKATIDKSDSSIWLSANMKVDHRIFGYEKPDTSSKKMILISIFTNDVENNPFNCKFGSYYQTSDMNDMLLKFVSKGDLFSKVNIIKQDSVIGSVYIQNKWLEFEE